MFITEFVINITIMSVIMFITEFIKSIQAGSLKRRKEGRNLPITLGSSGLRNRQPIEHSGSLADFTSGQTINLVI